MATIGARIVLAASSAARQLGQALDKMGASMEVAKYTERLVPSTRLVAVDGVAPTVSEASTFVAPSANVIGDVTIGANSSVWYGATIRGDVNKVTIGKNSSIGDRSMVHVAKIQGDFATSIGDNVTIGPGAIIHAAVLNDFCIVGASAQVLDGSVVQSNCILAPGSIVTPGTTVLTGEYWAGSPAKMVHKLSTKELAMIAEAADSIADLAALHAVECAKDVTQLAVDAEEYSDQFERDPGYFEQLDVEPDEVLGRGAPGRIFDTVLSKPPKDLDYQQKLDKKNEY